MEADEACASGLSNGAEVMAFSFWSYVAETLRGAQGRRFRLERVARIRGEVVARAFAGAKRVLRSGDAGWKVRLGWWRWWFAA